MSESFALILKMHVTMNTRNTIKAITIVRHKYFAFFSCTGKVSLDNTWISQRKSTARFHLSALDFYLCQTYTYYYFSDAFFSLGKSSCHFV